MNLPKDPIMLLSVVNTQLRDNYSNLEALADAYETTTGEICEKLKAVGYEYVEEQNQFK